MRREAGPSVIALPPLPRAAGPVARLGAAGPAHRLAGAGFGPGMRRRLSFLALASFPSLPPNRRRRMRGDCGPCRRSSVELAPLHHLLGRLRRRGGACFFAPGAVPFALAGPFRGSGRPFDQAEVDLVSLQVHPHELHPDPIRQAVADAGALAQELVAGIIEMEVVLAQFGDVHQALDEDVVQGHEHAERGDRRNAADELLADLVLHVVALEPGRTPIIYAEDRLELIESMGLDVVAAEPESLAVFRS